MIWTDSSTKERALTAKYAEYANKGWGTEGKSFNHGWTGWTRKIFSGCADSHTFCEPIHSEDTNLFPIMKKPSASKTPLAPLPPVQGSRSPLSRFNASTL